MKLLAKRQSKKWKYDLERDGVTQGLLLRWLRCRKSAKLYLEKLSPILVKTHLDFGDCFHQVLDTWNEAIMEQQIQTRDVKKLIHKLTDLGRGVVDYFQKTNSGTTTNPGQFETNMGFIRYMIPYYLKAREYGRRYAKIDFLERDWIESEKVFRNVFRGFIIRGKRDGLFTGSGGTYLRETKTTSQISEDKLAMELVLNFQIKTYIVCAEQEKKIEIDGCDYNIIRRPTFSNMDNFKKKIKEQPEHFFHRYEITFSPEDMDEFKRHLEHILYDFAEWCSGNMFTYPGFGACTGRKWDCEFLPLCSENRHELYKTRENLFEEINY